MMVLLIFLFLTGWEEKTKKCNHHSVLHKGLPRPETASMWNCFKLYKCERVSFNPFLYFIDRLLNSWIFSLFHIVCHPKGLLWPLCVSVPVRLWPSTYRQCHTRPTCSPASLFLQAKWRQTQNGKSHKYDLRCLF